MLDKTKRSGVGQAWLAQRVGVSLYSAFIMILCPRKPFFENSRLQAVSKTLLFQTVPAMTGNCMYPEQPPRGALDAPSGD
jgi:hypothetical protein